MKIESGPIFFALMVGVLLTAAASWIVAGLYRRQMLALMRGGPAPEAARTATGQTIATTVARRVEAVLDISANRRASWRYLLALSGLSLLIGITQSVLALLFVYGEALLTPGRALTLGLVYAWPMALTWGLLRRWLSSSRLKLRHRHSEQHPAIRRVGEHAQRPTVGGSQGRRPLPDLIRRRDDRAAFGQQLLPCRREMDPPRGAREQRQSELPLEVRDRPADRCFRDFQGAGRR